MDEKESTVSGSPGNSESDSASPTVTSTAVAVPQATSVNMNLDVAVENMGTERRNNVSAVIAAGSGGGGGGGGVEGQGSGSVGKKKRGRPRKYDADGNLRVKSKPLPFQFQQSMSGGGGVLTQLPPSGFSFLTSSPPPSEQFLTFSSFSSSSSSKRGRGRPPGSGNWQLLASLGELFANTAGGDFTPHVVTVNTGEDVAGKIVSLWQKGPRGICVLSANGAVSNVTIRQPGSSGGILTYEGRFEILSLCGSFTVTEAGGVRSRTGGLSVSLAGPDGRVIGGGVAGLLLAASPIQIVVGSFTPNGNKTQKRKHYRENTMASVVPGAPEMVTAARPISEAKPAGQTYVTSPASLTDKDASPSCPAISGQGHRGADNIETGKQMPVASNSNTAGCWNATDHMSNQRPSPDINVSLPSEDDIQGIV